MGLLATRFSRVAFPSLWWLEREDGKEEDGDDIRNVDPACFLGDKIATCEGGTYSASKLCGNGFVNIAVIVITCRRKKERNY